MRTTYLGWTNGQESRVSIHFDETDIEIYFEILDRVGMTGYPAQRWTHSINAKDQLDYLHRREIL